jgi:hypothetical protein
MKVSENYRKSETILASLCIVREHGPAWPESPIERDEKSGEEDGMKFQTLTSDSNELDGEEYVIRAASLADDDGEDEELDEEDLDDLDEDDDEDDEDTEDDELGGEEDEDLDDDDEDIEEDEDDA